MRVKTGHPWYVWRFVSLPTESTENEPNLWSSTAQRRGNSWKEVKLVPCLVLKSCQSLKPKIRWFNMIQWFSMFIRLAIGIAASPLFWHTPWEAQKRCITHTYSYIPSSSNAIPIHGWFNPVSIYMVCVCQLPAIFDKHKHGKPLWQPPKKMQNSNLEQYFTIIYHNLP